MAAAAGPALEPLPDDDGPASSCAHSSYSETISWTISSTSDVSTWSEARNVIGSVCPPGPTAPPLVSVDEDEPAAELGAAASVD